MTAASYARKSTEQAGIIDLRLEHFESPVSTLPEVLHHFTREQMLKEGFAV